MKIAIIGPESSGKSTLSEALATAIGCRWVKEYARDYVEGLRRPYNYLDVLHIARQQLKELTMPYAEGEKHIIYDTDLIITKVWLEYKYGSCPEWIKRVMGGPFSIPIDLYLLCYPDLPFVADPVREHPNEREELYAIYLQEVKRTGLPYTIIRGANRLEQALQAIRQF